jgi:hypothetical protein
MVRCTTAGMACTVMSVDKASAAATEDAKTGGKHSCIHGNISSILGLLSPLLCQQRLHAHVTVLTFGPFLNCCYGTAHLVVSVSCLPHLHQHISALRATPLVGVAGVERSRPVRLDGCCHLRRLQANRRQAVQCMTDSSCLRGAQTTPSISFNTQLRQILFPYIFID